MIKNFFLAFCILLGLHACHVEQSDGPFKVLDQNATNLKFSNDLTDTEEFNILEYLYYYNGGGVAIGDINNDGLPDIYLCGNQVSDKLFINKGNFRFEDFSNVFPANSLNGWSTGVTMVDINHDGYLDIYVSRVGDFKTLKDKNKLFINQKGESFTEEAEKFNLDFSGLSTQAAFFDYDRDGDLDCYLLNHSIKDASQFRPSEIRENRDSISGDKLMENRDNFFVDVTKEAGIFSSNIGFGLGVDVADVNNDGWLDIYVGNDFHEQDYLYLNQGDKTFIESIARATGHTSNFSMGCTIADLNNDLQQDILTMDMKAPDDVDYKKSGGWESMQIYNYKRSFGYHHQSAKNAVQINQGVRNGVPQFSELSSYYGLSSTDWSWSPLVCDFDNDGDKDIFVTNGIEVRPNDLDFVKFHFNDETQSDLAKLKLIPSGLIKNRYFEHEIGSNSFIQSEIGFDGATTGAALGDLNLDGRMDVVLNNVNAPATILSNISVETNHFITLELKDTLSKNVNALGASVELYQGDLLQSNDIKSSSGFQSFNEAVAHFGLSSDVIDSLVIKWADGFVQVVDGNTVKINARNVLYRKDDKEILPDNFIVGNSSAIKGYKDFKSVRNNQVSEKWLLYEPECKEKLIFDLDSLNLLIVSKNQKSSELLDTRNNILSSFLATKKTESYDILEGRLFDGFYYLVTQHKVGDEKMLSLRCYDISGNEVNTVEIFRGQDLSYAKIILDDVDSDDDLDLIVGGHYRPKNYGAPFPTIMYLNQNNSFSAKEILPSSLVYDMQLVNLDADNDKELVVVGHWMPITIIDELITDPIVSTIANSEGFWFSVNVNDFNNDGKQEIVAGNFGLNHDLKISLEQPLLSYSSDFDLNGQDETLITYFVDDREVPYLGHEIFIDQLPIAKREFLKATDYAKASVKEIISKEKLNNAKLRKVKTFSSTMYLQRDGNWQQKELPYAIQNYPITQILFDDNLLFLLGNISDIDPNLGRQDGGKINVLKWENDEWTLMNKQMKFPVENGIIRDASLVNSSLYYIVENDSLRFIKY